MVAACGADEFVDPVAKCVGDSIRADYTVEVRVLSRVIVESVAQGGGGSLSADEFETATYTWLGCIICTLSFHGSRLAAAGCEAALRVEAR